MAHVALITGGGRGIGREIALALARAGCAVAVGSRSGAALRETAEEAQKIGVRAMPVALDVSDASSIEHAVGDVVEALGPIDVLVNNAGIAESATFPKTDPEMWNHHLRVNVTGPYLAARAVVPGMLERRWGRVINIASLAGLFGAPYVTAYTASKHALVGFTRALAAEVAGKGVTVNAICPGYVATDLTWSSARYISERTGRSFDEAVAALARMNAGHRLLEPAEVAAVAVRLLNDEVTNGDTIVLDGSGPIPEPASHVEPSAARRIP